MFVFIHSTVAGRKCVIVIVKFVVGLVFMSFS